MTDRVAISEHWSEDGRSRCAKISLLNGRYIIDFFENSDYAHTALYSYQDKALNYVEDAAENFVQGRFDNYKLIP